MSDNQAEEKSKQDEYEQPKANAMAAFSDRFDELEEALSLLYIRNNASGRNKFREKWPNVARYIFGEQLIQYDNEGTQDIEHRRKLEEEAGQRRILLKATMVELVDKSVDSGQLQFDYVGSVIDEFGPDLSKFLYAEDVIERVRPGLLAKSQADKDARDKDAADEQEAKDEGLRQRSAQYAGAGETGQSKPAEETPEEKRLSAEEKNLLRNAPEDEDTALDSVRPIDTETQSAPSSRPSQEGSTQPAAAEGLSKSEKDSSQDKNVLSQAASHVDPAAGKPQEKTLDTDIKISTQDKETLPDPKDKTLDRDVSEPPPSPQAEDRPVDQDKPLASLPEEEDAAKNPEADAASAQQPEAPEKPDPLKTETENKGAGNAPASETAMPEKKPASASGENKQPHAPEAPQTDAQPAKAAPTSTKPSVFGKQPAKPIKEKTEWEKGDCVKAFNRMAKKHTT